VSGGFRPETAIGEVDFCAFDLETTGLSSYSRVLEIGAVRFRSGEEPETFATLVKVGQPIQSGAYAVHGIDESMLDDAPPPHEAVSAFLKFCGSSVLVAHNARFDVAMLSLELTILGMTAPANPVLDSLALSRKAFRQLDNHRLETIARHLDVPTDRMHRALPDAQAVRGILETALRNGSPREMRTLGDLMECTGSALYFQRISTVTRESERFLRAAAVLPALNSSSIVHITYLGGSKGEGERPVRPLRLVERNGVEYLDAVCLIDGRRKFFRIDLIADMR
jgi:DNA polymerase III epsilon subunit family exonuclease